MDNTIRITSALLKFGQWEMRYAADLLYGLEVEVAAFVFEEPSSDIRDCRGFLVAGATLVPILDKKLRATLPVSRVAGAQLLKRWGRESPEALVFIPRRAATVVKYRRGCRPQRDPESLRYFPPDLWGRISQPLEDD
jgi:hypothetical protein